jgi:UDP-N-acetylmuramate--alanine ligase
VDTAHLFKNINHLHIHMVGIKGTGMTALAEILKSRGAFITGSDTDDVFYTDEILANLNIPVAEDFSPANVGEDVKLIVYSSAYSVEKNPELQAGIARSIPLLTYPRALGLLSADVNASGIAGVHGKTTTTAITGTILKELHFPATIITGSRVPSFNHSATLRCGDAYLIAETCEYKRHFLNFKADQILLTNVELDHPDYFHSLEEIEKAFLDYVLSLPQKGVLIYNEDNPGAADIARQAGMSRTDIRYVPYGKTAEGRFRITNTRLSAGEIRFSLAGIPEDFSLAVPGEHTVSNTAGAIALSVILLEKEQNTLAESDIVRIQEGCKAFRGSKRRSEILGQAGGILFLDDYAHHPTAVNTTLAGYRDFFPGRRIVADFMSHTYSRTKELLQEFGTAFSSADEVVLHKIYASAREKNDRSITGKDLYVEVAKHHNHVYYKHTLEEAVPFLKEILRPGDLFVTMGAGDNWKIGRQLYDLFQDD